MLTGKKTYVGILAGTVWALLGIFGVVDPGSQEYQATAAVIAAWTGVAVRMAIGRVK